MKIKILIATMVVLTASLAQATLFSSGTISVNSPLPDGNPVGFVSTASINTLGDPNVINGVSVTLNLSGGYNGDLYGYLVNPSGNLAVLLNRVGTGEGGAIQSAFGYSDAGMNVRLSDPVMSFAPVTLAGAIHSYQTVPSYDITSGTTAWSPDNGPGNFTALHNGSAHGTWTLFLADMTGGNQSTLVSWALDVSVVPEPSTWSLIIFGSLAAGTVVVRRFRRSPA
jgi:subtilisin-like proprotein convertase family protein